MELCVKINSGDCFTEQVKQSLLPCFHFASLDFQSLEGIVKAIGLDPCELCTYCWNGKE